MAIHALATRSPVIIEDYNQSRWYGMGRKGVRPPYDYDESPDAM